MNNTIESNSPVIAKATDGTDVIDSATIVENPPTISVDDLSPDYDAMPHASDQSLSAEGSIVTNKLSADEKLEKKEEEDDQADEENPEVDRQGNVEPKPAAIEAEESGVIEGSAAASKVAEVLDEEYSASLSKGGISMSTLGWSGLAIAGLGLAVGGGGSSAKPPVTPNLALAEDTGLAGDAVTNNGVILVTGLVESGSWEYSLNNGQTWIAGQGDRFEIDQSGSYAIVARQLEGDRESEISTVLNVELDFTAPVLAADTALVIEENSGANQIIYSLDTQDAAVTYSLAPGADAALSINSSTGAVSLIDDPDAETQASYSFTLVATDTAGNVSEQTISLDIADLDEAAPVITSSSTVSIVENSGADQVIYSASADDSTDLSAGVTFSLTAGSDTALSIDGSTGEVRLSDNPDYELQDSYAFTLVATDGAGNGDEQGVVVTVQDVDEIPPSINAVESSVQDQMVTLRYSENLSVADLPDTSSFTIRQDGLELQVSSITIVDNTVQLAISAPLSAGALQVSYAGLELQDEAGNSAASFSQIVVSDGYIRGVEVYLDADGDGQADADELLVGVTSNSNGEVIFEGDIGSADLIIKGGVNTDTGAVNELSLSAPTGYSVINPLSTLVAQVAKANESEENFSLDQAEQIVVASLGLELAEGQGLGKYDPLSDVSESSLNNRIATAQIATILSVVVAAATDAETAVSAQALVLGNLVTIITDSAATNDSVVFDASTVAAILTSPDSGTGGTSLVSSSSLVELQSAVAQLEVATTIDEVVATQAAATDSTSTSAPVIGLLNSSDTGVTGDNITSDSSPTVSVAFDANALDGSAAVVGDLIRVFSTLEGQTSTMGSAVITAADLATGTVQITTTAIADGVANLTAQITDIAGNISDSAPLLSVLVDTAAPLFVSSQDTAVDENSGAAQIVYSAASSDEVNVTYSMAAGSDSALSVDGSTGEVSLSENPDEESQASYSFTLIATDAAGNASEQSVTLAVTDLDEIAPTINSAATAAVIENSGASQVIYTASADDSTDISGGVTFSLAQGSDPALSIEGSSGAVTLSDDPDKETQSSYSFTVVATDAAGNVSEQAVTLSITDLDEIAPSISSSATASVAENSGTDQIVYTVSADDSADISDGVSFSLADGSDAALSINSATGAVTLSDNPDEESQASYDFTVVATDAADNTSEQAVTLSITDLDEIAPSITSGATASVAENSGTDQIIYTASADDSADISSGVIFSLAEGSDTALSINGTTGAVTLSDDPDEETQSSYGFMVVATDAAGNVSEQVVTLSITDLDEIAPTINSAATAAVIENSGASQVIYTASADDSTDISGGVTFSLADTSDAALSVNSTTGAVTLNDDPDEETQSSYSFTVVATDAAGNASEQAVTLAVGDVDDTAPTITSQSNASAVDYQSILYAASADDTADISGGVSFGIKPDVGDADLLSIDSQTGVVSLASGITRYSANSSYSFTLLASDGVNAIAEQQITVAVTAPIAVSGPGVLAQGGMRPTLTTDDDGNSVIAITLDPSVVNDYPSGIENVDFTLVYDIAELGTVETTQLSYPSGGISVANTSVDGQIGVSIIWFPATVSDGSLLTLTYSADDSVTTTTVRLEDVIVGDDDLTNSTYVLGETVITQGTENAEVFLMSGGSATVAGGVGADIFALTETAGSDMSISDFEAGLDSIQMSSLVSALGYISIAQSGDERQDLSISKLVDIPTDIANLIASNDTALDNTFAAYFSQESSKLTVFVDSATSAGSVDIATYEIGLSGESSFDLDDLQLASPLFIA